MVTTGKKYVDFATAELAGTVESTDKLLVQRNDKQLQTTAVDIASLASGEMPSPTVYTAYISTTDLITEDVFYDYDMTALALGAGTWDIHANVLEVLFDVYNQYHLHQIYTTVGTFTVLAPSTDSVYTYGGYSNNTIPVQALHSQMPRWIIRTAGCTIQIRVKKSLAQVGGTDFLYGDLYAVKLGGQ